MCGIGGVLRIDGQRVLKRWLEGIDGRIAHRGPDGSGQFRDRVKVERRLTIDLQNEGESIVDPAVRVIQREGGRVHLAFDPEEIATTELISRLTARHAVRDLFVENAPIEEVITRLYDANGVQM